MKEDNYSKLTEPEETANNVKSELFLIHNGK